MTSPLIENVRPADPRNPSVAKRASLWWLPFGQTAESQWTEFGTIIDGALAPAIAYLEHYSNRRGAKTRDRIEISEVKADFKFKLDEVSSSNLAKIFGASADKAASTAVLRDGANFDNPGGGLSIALPAGSVSLDGVIVRSTNEEGVVTTFDEDTLSTDTTDDTAGGTWNNTTNPITIVAASYPGTPTAVGSLIKVENEILRVSAFGGGNITLQRAQVGTTAAAHANGVSIFKDAGNDYVPDLTNGSIYILPAGDLNSASTVPQVHNHWWKTVATEKVQIFDGTPIRGKAQLIVLTKNGLRITATFNSVVITNDGDITFGDGSKWIECGLKMECLADGTGSLGDLHRIDASATF